MVLFLCPSHMSMGCCCQEMKLIDKTNWNYVLELSKSDTENSLGKYLRTNSNLIATHVWTKNKKRMKMIISAIQNSVKKEKYFFKTFIKCKNSKTKSTMLNDFKRY